MVVDREKLLQRANARVEDFHRLMDAGLICQSGDFWPSVHYPPITMYRPVKEGEDLLEGFTMPDDELIDIYVHIPFCARHCVFCHYPVLLGEQMEEKDKYLDALEREMELFLQRMDVKQVKARSVLFGGGTPTFLTPKQLERNLKYFNRMFDISKCGQFNYDVDPVTLIDKDGTDRLKIMQDHGVDRLTIGFQSLDPHVLKMMGRHHGVQECYDVLEACRKFDFQLNIEFIFGHPGETIDNWIEVMEKAVTLPTDEIQLYRLKVEAYGDYQGPVKTLKEKRPEDVPTHDEAIMMKQIAHDILNANGYYENLRRVFAKKREHFSLYAHNQCCMLHDEIGFGLTAFSSMRDRFRLNTQSMKEYYTKIEKGQLPVNRGLIRNLDQNIRWSIILPLKNRDIYKPNFQRICGIPIDGVFQRKFDLLKEHGLIEEDEYSIRLTKLGRFFADEVVEGFHHPDHVPFPRNAYTRGPLYPYDNAFPYETEMVLA